MREPLTKPGNFTRCYGCGEDNPRGLALRFWREGDTVVADFVPAPEHGGYGKIAHGGVVATAIDEALGWAIYGLLGKLGVTTDLNVRFLAPVTCGTRYLVRATVESQDDRGAIVLVTIATDGKSAAEGRGTMRFVSSRAIERMGGFSWS